MSTFFLSDLHLSQDRPEMILALEELLSGPLSQANAIYVLGNFFEHWLGDDSFHTHEFAPRIAEAFMKISSGGVRVFFQRGNRDFMLGQDFVKSTGGQLLPDECRIDLYGVETLLLHGDQLCTDDVHYQQVRKMTRNEDWQAMMLAKPLEERRAFAKQAAEESSARRTSSYMEIVDVNDDAVKSMFHDFAVKRMIHGHTHRPGKHTLIVDGQERERYVLGDWYTKPNILEFNERGSCVRSTPYPEQDLLALTIDGLRLKLVSLTSDGRYRFLDEHRELHNILYVDSLESDSIRAAIDELEELINSSTAKEANFQSFFEIHPTFLLGDHHQSAHPHIVLSNDSGSTLVPDFMLKPIDQNGLCDLLELKLPSNRVIVGSGGRERYSAIVSSAIAQLGQYRNFFDDERNRRTIQDRYGLVSYKPHTILVIGRRTDINPLTFREVEHTHPGLQLQTYDDIVLRMRSRMEAMKKGILRFSD